MEFNLNMNFGKEKMLLENLESKVKRIGKDLGIEDEISLSSTRDLAVKQYLHKI